MSIDKSREAALKILYDIDVNGAYSNVALNKTLENAEFRNIDRGFITELVYGTIKWKLSIDYTIERFSSVKLKKISPFILNILRLGIYQLLYLDRIPDSAACNESVKLAKRYGHEATSKFVNAILRNILRNKENIIFPDREKDIVKYLSVRFSHPEWMVANWVKRYGAEFTQELLIANNATPDFTVRVNTLKTSRSELIELLHGEGIKAHEGKYLQEALILENPSSITKLDAFNTGLFQVQDESSMLSVKVLNPEQNDTVVDVCSAPGGKSTFIGELMKNKGSVIARDVHEHKLGFVNEAAKRLGLDIIHTQLYDAAKLDDALIGKADKVLVDAPCTGLGIIRKKPDIKWSKNSLDKGEITKLQKTILYNASKYTKPGGVVVYSTCTLEPEENQDIVKGFINDNDDFCLEDFTLSLPDNLDKKYLNGGFVNIYPNVHGIDGFFIAKLRKRS